MSINLNSQGVNNYNKTKNINTQTTEQEAKQEQTKAPEKTQVNDVDTFTYMNYNSNTLAIKAMMNSTSQPKATVGDIIADTILGDDVTTQVAKEVKDLYYDALIENANAMPPEDKASIEASMGKFQEGVVSYVPLVEEELGATASEPAVLAVAAGMLLNDNE